jgi:hypothetical protein
MAKRHQDALIVSDGASNALAVARAIADGIREIDNEKGRREDDPALCLMLHQLQHLLCKDMDVDDSLTQYHAARLTCERLQHGS